VYAPPPPTDAGEICDASHPCCTGLYCRNPYTSQSCTRSDCVCGPSGCSSIGADCDAGHPCCAPGYCANPDGVTLCSGAGCSCVQQG
jgi:hypothetical protein